MRKLSMLVIVSMMFSLLATITPYFGSASNKVNAAVTNLMLNGGFESTTTTSGDWVGALPLAPSNWTSAVYAGTVAKDPGKTVNVSLDTAVYHEGSKSLLFDAFTLSRLSTNQDVTKDLQAGKSYKLTVWMKTDSVAGTGGAYFRTQYFKMSPTWTKVSDGPSTYSTRLKGTNGWTAQQVVFTVPATTTGLRTEIFLENATGKLWIDDVVLEEYVGLTGISLDQSALVMAKDSTLALTPAFTPATAGDKTVVWSTSNPSVATVDTSGNVTGVGIGSATITVATPDGSVKAQSLVSVESAEAFQSYGQLRTKWYNKLTGDALYNADDADIAANVNKQADSVKNVTATGFWDTLNKAPNRTNLWSDLNDPAKSAQMSSAYTRVKTMALAYTTRGSDLYHNETLKTDILGAIDWLYTNRYNETKTVNDNWWDWEIGTPQLLNDILTLMYDQLTSSQITKYLKPIDQFVPDPKKRKSNANSAETGANLLDKALVVTMRGVVGNNSAKIVQGRDAIGPEFIYTTQGDGVYKDGSLVQHVNIAYTAGYGAVWLNRAADMTYVLNGSPWPVTDPNVNNIYDWVSSVFEPVIYKGLYMDMTNGRGMSRQTAGSARSTITTLLRLAEGAPADVALSIRRMVKEWALTDTTYSNYVDGLGIYEVSLVKNLLNDASIARRGELIKNQVFAGMDRVVHLRDDYGFGLSLFSNRISAFEKGNDENLKGWYTGIGMTYLYDNDLTQYRNDFWPTVDSFRLPGTTTNGSGKGVTPVEWKSYMNTKSWVGGSTIDSIYGASGMDFSLSQVTGSDLEGKKSWFMFDDEIVALGSGITSSKSEPQPVETIIDNRKINDAGDNVLTVDGVEKSSQLGWSETMNNVTWAHLSGNVPGSDIGYYFPEAADVNGLREARTGSWSQINKGQSTTPITRNYVSLAFEHGVTASNASYEYVMLPHKSVEEMANYSIAPDVEVLSNTTDVHAVREKKLGITAANFWNPATVDFLTSQNAASVMVKETGNELSVAVSDPTQKQSKITLELKKQVFSVVSSDAAIKVLQTSPTLKLEVNVAGALGQTKKITLSKDTTAPVTTDDANPNWQRTAQTVTLAATDEVSGVQQKFYSVDNGAFTEGSSVVIAEDGVHHISYYSVDNAGNEETVKTATVKIDSVAPVIVPTVTMDVYWADGGSLQFDISDAASGVVSKSLQLDGNPVSLPYVYSASALTIGAHTVMVQAADAAGNVTNAEYVLTVWMRTGDSMITPNTASFDKNVSNSADVEITVTQNGDTLTEIRNGSYVLSDSDYTVKGNVYTISKNYLSQQPVGATTLTFDFSEGEDATLVISVTDTTPAMNSVITPSTASFDKKPSSSADVEVTVALNGNTLTAIRNGSYELNGSDYTVSGNVYKISKAYLSQQPVGATTLTFDFSEGEDATLVITISNSEQTSNSGYNPGVPVTTNPDHSKIEVKPEYDSSSKTAKAEVKPESLSDAFSRIEADADGMKKVTVEVSKVEDAKTYEVSLQADFLQQDAHKRQVELKTELATVVLPDNMLKKSEAKGTTAVTVSVSSVDKSSLTEESRSVIGNRPVIDIVLKLDGEIVKWNNPNANVSVTIPYSATEDELRNAEHLVIWYIDGAGNVQPIYNGKYDLATGTITFTTNHFSTYAVAFVNKTFQDLDSYTWAKKQVEVLASKGIIEGVSAETFAPEKAVTRADFLMLLVKTLGLTAAFDSNFDDVQRADYYYDAVGIAKQLGITDGDANHMFRPSDQITRQDMFVLTERALRISEKTSKDKVVTDPLQPFNDKELVAAYAKDAIAQLIKRGFVEGDGQMIHPLANATRAETAVFLYRMYQLQ